MNQTNGNAETHVGLVEAGGVGSGGDGHVVGEVLGNGTVKGLSRRDRSVGCCPGDTKETLGGEVVGEKGVKEGV
jgi:hypothetical protein